MSRIVWRDVRVDSLSLALTVWRAIQNAGRVQSRLPTAHHAPLAHFFISLTVLETVRQGCSTARTGFALYVSHLAKHAPRDLIVWLAPTTFTCSMGRVAWRSARTVLFNKSIVAFLAHKNVRLAQWHREIAHRAHREATFIRMTVTRRAQRWRILTIRHAPGVSFRVWHVPVLQKCAWRVSRGCCCSIPHA